jgi:hypothetical protein
MIELETLNGDARGFGDWGLELLWNLVLGIWDLPSRFEPAVGCVSLFHELATTGESGNGAGKFSAAYPESESGPDHGREADD